MDNELLFYYSNRQSLVLILKRRFVLVLMIFDNYLIKFFLSHVCMINCRTFKSNIYAKCSVKASS